MVTDSFPDTTPTFLEVDGEIVPNYGSIGNTHHFPRGLNVDTVVPHDRHLLVEVTDPSKVFRPGSRQHVAALAIEGAAVEEVQADSDVATPDFRQSDAPLQHRIGMDYRVRGSREIARIRDDQGTPKPTSDIKNHRDGVE